MKETLLFLSFALSGPAVLGAAVTLSPESEMSFTLKDVVTYCSLVAGLGMTWATLQSRVSEASRIAVEADRKAAMVHERLDDFFESQGKVQLEVARLEGAVSAFSDRRFTDLQTTLNSLHQSLAQAGLTERRGEPRT